MQLELVRRYLLALTLKYLDSKRGEEWVSAFRRVNVLYLHWPLEVEYVQSRDLYRVEDREHRVLFITYTNVLNRFKKGIQARLDSLAKEYMVEKCSIKPNDVVIDVGANVGEFAKHMIEEYGAKVIAVEPEPREFDCLRQNTESKGCVCLKTALWNEETTITLFHKSDTSDTSLIEPPEFDSTSNIRVFPMDGIREISTVEKIKLIKVEAEGAEPEIIEGAKDTLQKTEYVSVDCGPERGLKQEATLVPVLERLEAVGFRLIHHYHQRGCALFQRSSLCAKRLGI